MLIMFNEYLSRWELTLDGDPVTTRNSGLVPVRQRGVPAMLKVAIEAEEKVGGGLMIWWGGRGAARVLAHHGDALLLERATDERTLTDLARTGHDDEASHIICDVVADLHAPRGEEPPKLVPLTQWFQGLAPVAATHGGILLRASATARDLLAAPLDTVVLHGDIHHGNILDFGSRGWLAIDPKGLLGERGFDYANIFCNPDHSTATAPDVFTRRIDVIASAARFDRKRLLQWILAWAGLSAAWHLGAATSPHTALEVAKLAAAELSR
jgi:streptomycin 6-kinase